MRHHFGKKFGFAVASLLAMGSPVFAQEKPWDAVPQFHCSDVVTSSGEFTAKTEAMFTWLVGYMNGVNAVATLDKRLSNLNDAGSFQVGPMVLAFCTKNQGDTIMSATTAVAEFVINAQAGKRITLKMAP